MSIVKSANTLCNTKAGLKGTIDYIFAENKTDQDLCFVTRDYMDLEYTPAKILRNFVETKEMFKKTDKRQCKQFIISWHEDSPITREEALDICKEWAEKVFPDFTCAIAIHKDRNVHGHVLVNSVSYVDGTKYHMNPWELTQAKEIYDQMNEERGFDLTEKGKHFDGSEIEPGTIRSYDKNTYVALTQRDSAIAYIATAVLDAKNTATDKDEFIQELELEYGIITSWEDGGKYITFTDTDSSIKVRNNKLGNTVTLDFSMEALLHEFERNKELQNERAAEKAKLDEGRGILEERIREIAEELTTSHSDSGTSAENHPEERRRDGDTNYREWSVERLAGQVAENEQRSNRFLKWGKNVVRKLEAYLNRFRDSGSERRLILNELEWEARQLAECMEEIRCNYSHYDYDLKTFLLPWLKKRPIFEPEVDTVYRHELDLLDEFRYTINTAEPIILILTQSMRTKNSSRTGSQNFKIRPGI